MIEVTFLRLDWLKGRHLWKNEIDNVAIPENAVETKDGNG